MSLFKQKLNPISGQLNLVSKIQVASFKDAVASESNLPLTGNSLGDARITNDTQNLYVWSKDASSGLLSDWANQGNFIDLDWSLISSKPSSSVANIDDAVAKKHTQNTDLYLDTSISTVLYVDGNRTDIYTANGSITKPFKTIMAAINSVTDASANKRYAIDIVGGKTYSEQVILKAYVGLRSPEVARIQNPGGVGHTIVASSMSAVSRLQNLVIINNSSDIEDAAMFLGSGGNVGMTNCSLTGETGYGLKMTAGAFIADVCIFRGVANSVKVSGGNCITNFCTFDATTFDVNVTGGTFKYLAPYFKGNGITGVGTRLQKADTIKNTPAGNISSTDVQAAINELDTEKQASLGFTPEDVSNKDTTITLGTSDTKYPSQKAVKTYVDALGLDTASVKDMFLNIILNAFRIAQVGSLTIFSMIKGFIDEYEDESGVDVYNSINQSYDSINDYYFPINGDLEADSYTSLLLHLNNSVYDSSSTHKTVTNNNVTFSDSIFKFLTHSAYFNGNAYLSIPSTEDLNFDANFTIDFWLYPTNLTDPGYVIGTAGPEVGTDGWSWFYEAGGTASFYAMFDGGWSIFIQHYNPNLLLNQWNHIAIVREGSICRCFTNGIYKAQDTSANCSITSSQPLRVGFSVWGEVWGCIGYIDEIRISKGIARWLGSSSFTPPTEPYFVGKTNMTLLSNAQVADDVPTSARIILFEEDVDVITLNTDIKAYISRDNGVTYSQVTLEDEGNYITLARVLSGVVDISTQPSDTDVKYKIETFNYKNLKLHGTAVSWR